jgi:hypothetical protein
MQRAPHQHSGEEVTSLQGRPEIVGRESAQPVPQPHRGRRPLLRLDRAERLDGLDQPGVLPGEEALPGEQ